MIRKRGVTFFSILLVALLCVSLVPATVLAEEDGPVITSVSVMPSTLTEGYAANVAVEIKGSGLDGAVITARIRVNGEEYAAPVENGRAVIYIPVSADMGSGHYEVDILVDGEVKKSGEIEVLPAPEGLWKLGVNYNQELDAPALDIVFGESVMPKGSNYSVTVNGKAVACKQVNDKVVRITQATHEYLTPGVKHDIRISGVRYQEYFPSYSFTFAISYSI